MSPPSLVTVSLTLVDITWTRFGAPAHRALAAAVQEAQAHDPLAGVHVIAPNRYAALAARRSLARRAHGLVNVRCEPLSALAGLLATTALIAAGRRPLTNARRAAAIRAALPGAAPTPTTVRAYARAYDEIRHGEPQAWAAAAAHDATTARTVAIAEQVRAALVDCFDEEDCCVHAAQQVRAQPPHELGTLIWWLPQSCSPGEIALLRALRSVLPFTVVAGITGDHVADQACLTSMRAVLDVELTAPTIAPTLPDAPQLVAHRAPDPETEVRAALQGILRRAADGMSFAAQAIAARDADPYLRIVHEQAAAAGIPIAGPATRRLVDSVVGRFLSRTIALDPADLHRDEWIGWCADAPIRNPHTNARVASARWDAVSRRAGMVAGASMLTRLEHWHGVRAHDLATCPPDDERKARAIQRDLDDAAAIAEFLNGLFTDLADRAPRPWPEWSARLRSWISDYLGDVSRNRTWPDAELRAGEQIEMILDGFTELDGNADWATCTSALLAELHDSADAVGRFGTGVFVARVRDLVGTNFEHVTVLGVNDGVLPGPRRPDALLPDDARLAAGLPTHVEARAQERHAFLAAVAAGEHSICSFAITDPRRARAILPSRWLVQWAAIQHGAPLGAAELAALPATSWCSVATSFVQQLRTEPALQSADALTQVWMTDPDPTLLPDELRAIWDAATARRTLGLTPYEGEVGPGLYTLPTRSVSPTAYETWARCPRAYLFAYVLGLDPIQRPEALEDIRPDERGTLIHTVLDQFIRTARARTGPADAWDHADHAHLDHLFDAETAIAVADGRTGRAVQWEMTARRIRRLLHRFLDHDSEQRALTGMVPHTTELRFGLRDSTQPAVRIPDSDAALPAIHGAADRVDVSPDGSRAVVYDYKTGGRDHYRGITPENPTADGTRFQLPVYALAARDATGAAHVDAEYWFINEKDLTKSVTITLDDATIDTVRNDVRIITDAIRDGIFPGVPGAPARFDFANCQRCDFVDYCPGDRDRIWERVAFDPRLDPLPVRRTRTTDGDE